MTGSISKSVDSLPGDTLSAYQKGVQSARDFLRAVFSRNAADTRRAVGAADAPEHSDQQR
ncbi:hypothetical protein ACS7SF_04775 [Ralstonia sp. 25C]|uniref:hypothetical protein n=1 Tax=Ralstonia sp. 25C TaxID=3447363 RepID=UPI003F755841